MNTVNDEELLSFLKQSHKDAEGILMDPKDLVFEENVKMNCFYCGKYNSNWRCPPHLPDLDYKKMMREYEHGLFVILRYDLTEDTDYSSVRSESSVTLHKILLSLEKWMWRHHRSTAISFIGGSCKLCKGGCGKEHCSNAYMSRSPLEAIGVQVVKSVRKYGVELSFPADLKLTRIGLLLWQDEEG